MRGSRARRNWLPVMTALGIAALGIGFLLDANAVGDGVRRGLEICGGVLIPSLFPFMVLSVFLSYTDYARILSIPLQPVTIYVFKLPTELGVVVLLSLIGGYPVGAKMIASLLEQKRIDKATAERMLCFCVNSGPSFLIAAVGVGMFFDHMAGIILFITQTTATILIGWLISWRVPRPESRAHVVPKIPVATALVTAVQSATSAMLAMCAFAILFAALLSMLGAMGVANHIAASLSIDVAIVDAILSGFMEVTSGCIAAAKVSGTLSFALTSIIVSFSGLSVLFQIFSCFGDTAMNFRPVVVVRLVHAGISTAMAVPLYKRFCAHTSVWLAGRPALMEVDARTTLISVCLLGMCAIFTLSLGRAGGPRQK